MGPKLSTAKRSTTPGKGSPNPKRGGKSAKKKGSVVQGHKKGLSTEGKDIIRSHDDSEPKAVFETSLDEVREEERPLQALSKLTHFDLPTLRKLQRIFTEISESKVNDGIIDLHELTEAMGFSKSSSLLARTIFRLFDITQTKRINFRTWATTLSALSPEATLDEKIKFSFALYDLNADGKIDLQELRSLLIAAVKENVLELSDEDVVKICDHTLSTVDKDKNGTVEFSEYSAVMAASSSFLDSFTVDIDLLCDLWDSETTNRKSRISMQDSERRSEEFRAKKPERKKSASTNRLPDLSEVKEISGSSIDLGLRSLGSPSSPPNATTTQNTQGPSTEVKRTASEKLATSSPPHTRRPRSSSVSDLQPNNQSANKLNSSTEEIVV